MTILVAIIGLSALIVVHELGHLLAAKAMGVNVTEFGVGFGPPLLKKKVGKTLYSLRIILLGGFVKMAGMNDEEEGPESYKSKAAWRRALIIFAGPLANLLAAVLIFAVVFMSISPPTMEVETIMPGSLAADVGLQEGDRIVAVDGTDVESWRQFQEVIGDKQPGDEVALVVERDGELRDYLGALTADERDPGRALVGVQPKASEENYGPLEALWLGAEQTGRLIGLFGWFLGQLVAGEVSFYENAAGPVGIVNVGSTFASEGAFAFAQLLAFISVNLAVFNVLPVLPLDGGHLFFIAAEKVLGRPVSAEMVGRIAAVGIALILMLFVFSTYADLSKIFTGQPFIPEP